MEADTVKAKTLAQMMSAEEEVRDIKMTESEWAMLGEIARWWRSYGNSDAAKRVVQERRRNREAR